MKRQGKCYGDDLVLPDLWVSICVCSHHHLQELLDTTVFKLLVFPESWQIMQDIRNKYVNWVYLSFTITPQNNIWIHYFNVFFS